MAPAWEEGLTMDGRIMKAGFTQALIQGYTAPRLSARRILASGGGLQLALMMVALAYLVQAIFSILLQPGGFGIAGHLLAIIQQVIIFFLLSALVYGVGRMAGGTGSLLGSQLVVAWHALVTSVISPLAVGVSAATFQAQESGELPSGVLLLGVVYVAISYWLMANYVAELHGFRSAASVLGAIIGLTFVFAILLAVIASSITSA